MSKHSKWAKIKRQKGVTDIRRGKIFTKLSRAMTIAARDGGGDVETNPRLRMAVDRALAENMPKDNIQRAIDRASGPEGDVRMESFVLEGFGPDHAALVMDIVTDKRTRTVNEIRKILSDAGGALGETGTTLWMFERRGYMHVPHPDNADDAELAAIDAGAVEVERDQEGIDVYTAPEDTHRVADVLRKKYPHLAAPEVVLLPTSPLALSAEASERLQHVLDVLDEHDDVVNVATNATL